MTSGAILNGLIAFSSEQAVPDCDSARWPNRPRYTNSLTKKPHADCQKDFRGRRAKFEELRRTFHTLKRDERAQRLLIHELLLEIIHPIIAFLELRFRRDVERFVETAAARF